MLVELGPAHELRPAGRDGRVDVRGEVEGLHGLRPRPVNWSRNRADDAYRKANVTRVEVKLYPADADIAEHLEGLEEPRATYIKRLIREDMARRA